MVCEREGCISASPLRRILPLKRAETKKKKFLRRDGRSVVHLLEKLIIQLPYSIYPFSIRPPPPPPSFSIPIHPLLLSLSLLSSLPPYLLLSPPPRTQYPDLRPIQQRRHERILARAPALRRLVDQVSPPTDLPLRAVEHMRPLRRVVTVNQRQGNTTAADEDLAEQRDGAVASRPSVAGAAGLAAIRRTTEERCGGRGGGDVSLVSVQFLHGQGEGRLLIMRDG